MGERRRRLASEQGQVQVGTRFHLNEDEVLYLLTLRRRVWMYVCP